MTSNNEPSGEECMASAMVLLNEKFAESTGRDLAASSGVTPAQWREIQAASNRARRKR